MEPGKPSMRTLGPVTQQRPDSAGEETTSTEGVTDKGQSVSVVPADQVTAYLPKGRISFGKVKLLAREVYVHLPKSGFFHRAYSFLRNLPTNTHKVELWNTFLRLEKSLVTATENDAQSIVKSNSSGMTVGRDSEGAKVAALMVSAGLARLVSQDHEQNTLTIKFLRPQNLELQTQTVEMLAQHCPLCVNEKGALDWNQVVSEEREVFLESLWQLGANPDERLPASDWYTNPQVIEDFEVYELYLELEEKMAQLEPMKEGENQWDFARRRMGELVKVAADTGRLEISNFLINKTKNISIIGPQGWEDILEELEALHPLFAEKLQEATPDYSETLEVSPKKQKFHTPPPHSQLKGFLRENKLHRETVALKTVTDLANGDTEVPFPIEAAYRKAVEKETWVQMKKAFVALDLPEGRPIDLERMQQGLGKLYRYNSELCERCLDDTQRAAVVAEAEERMHHYNATKKELEKEYRNNPELDHLLGKEWVVPDDPFEGTPEEMESDDAPPISKDKDFMTPQLVYRLVKSYDTIAGYLKTIPSGKASMEELQQMAMQDAFRQGIPLELPDWQEAITRLPLSTGPEGGG